MSKYINHDLLKLLKSPSWVIFTAQNPDAQKLDPVTNGRLHRELIQKLQEAKLHFEVVFGRYNGHEEDAVIWFTDKPVTREIAADISKQYGQESVLTSEGLVYQDGSYSPVEAWTFPHAEPEDNYTLFRSTYFSADISCDRLR